ncbi:abc1 domain-containing [Trichoderma arundinaceum]|uniref:Protein YAE1 n=1 Tax=Trichoderma arundinaceum TaxID=490622 RepID=A0A395NC43_TRIAR|nr:abc1 domain-containing [Trichoderma arundinaceum]
MHFRPVEQSMDDEYLTQGGGGGGGGEEAALEAGAGSGPGSGGAYFSLDDVFGPESESGLGSGEDVARATADAAATVTSPGRPESPRHPSDMRRLETEHTTAGYREGISAAKERTVQAGFDEGFSLGATIGLAAGQLLGTLEGIEDALKSRLGDRAGSEDEEATAASRLLTEAREELSVPKIFSSDYWAPDGNWSYDVKPEASGGDEVLFPDVAAAHPLIRKWTAIVDEQVKLWKIDRSVLDGEDGDARMGLEAVDDAATGTSTIPLAPPASRQPLDW